MVARKKSIGCLDRDFRSWKSPRTFLNSPTQGLPSSSVGNRGSRLNSESVDLLAPAHLKLAPSPTRSLLRSQFCLLCRFSHKLHSASRLNPSMSRASLRLH